MLGLRRLSFSVGARGSRKAAAAPLCVVMQRMTIRRDAIPEDVRKYLAPPVLEPEKPIQDALESKCDMFALSEAEAFFASRCNKGEFDDEKMTLYFDMIRLYEKYEMWDMCLAIYNHLRSSTQQLLPLEIQSLILKVASRVDKNALFCERVFGEIENPDACAYSAMIFLYDRFGNSDQAKELYRKCCNAQVAVDQDAHAAALHACAREGDVLWAVQCYADYRKQGFKPTAKVLESMLYVYGSLKDLESSDAVLEQMSAQGISPTEETFKILAKLYGDRKKMDRLEQLFDKVVRSKIQGDSTLYTRIMSGFGRFGTEEQMERVLEYMSVVDVSPTVATYTVLVAAYTRFQQYHKGERVFQDLLSRNISYDSNLMNNLLKMYAEAGWQEKSATLKNNILQSQRKAREEEGPAVNERSLRQIKKMRKNPKAKRRHAWYHMTSTEADAS